MLQFPDFVHEIDHFHGSDNHTLTDMCDGSVFKNHPLFESDKNAIQIIGYFDEVELCNPLGSSTKKHKLGCIFFSVGNLRPKFRSRLKCIFIAAVATNPVIQRHGMNLFLKPFVDSMKTLSNHGLSVNLKGENRHFKVGIVTFLADTLAAHALGGFKESMSFSYRICRSCMATTEQIQSSFVESDFVLRSSQDHENQVQGLTGASHAANSIEFGINRQSLLDDIPHFSVAENLPHDIMHDLFEGVVPCEMKLLIMHLVNEKYFTIVTFNDRLRRYDFGYTERSDIPSLLDEKYFMQKPNQKIRQSASKMWMLAITLPLLVGDLVPEDSKVWALFAILLRICRIACSWQIKPDTIAYLGVLIEEHHYKFRQLYPHKSIIPKMHYMVHYPRQIVKYGPLIYSWTMRHEAKLSVVKRAASHGNFKNICYTVAKRTQHALCYHLNCGERFLSTYLEVSKTRSEVPFASEIKEVSDYYCNLDIPSETLIVHPTWIKFDYLHLKKYVYVYLGNQDIYPKFGKVMDIFTIQNETRYILRIQEIETLYFDSHFSAYSIKILHSFSFINVSCLPAYPVIHSHRGFSSPDIYLVLKQYTI